MQYMHDFAARLEETGEFVDSQALAPEGAFVRYDGEGRPPVTDGPFVETKDLIAVALTLRAVGGLTTRQIATAYLVPEATMAQRISRAKRRIAGCRSTSPAISRRCYGCRRGDGIPARTRRRPRPRRRAVCRGLPRRYQRARARPPHSRGRTSATTAAAVSATSARTGVRRGTANEHY